MKTPGIETRGAASNAPRPAGGRSGLLCIGALGSALCLSLPMPMRAQGAPATRDARATTLARSTTMTELTTDDVPCRTPAARTATEDTTIRPFTYHASDAALADLHRRVEATKWPSQELVTDASQGVQLATMRELARYWQAFDWRKFEARLNALPQFVTTIDGVDIQFIHVRSKNARALPIIITHGWPGSIIEQTKIIGPLTDPAAYGGKAEDSFDVVIPSLPGYGFSS